jgi:serine/threonine-protein kinase RsbT
MAEKNVFRRSFPVEGGDFSHAGEVSVQIKNLLKEMGINGQILRRAAIASFEAEMNVIMYAAAGTFELTVSPMEVRISVIDEGPGIPDIELAMTEGYSTATPEMRERGFGAGMGLPNIKKNADTFRLQSKPNLGTWLEFTIRREGART